jgi:hypothetical protein
MRPESLEWVAKVPAQFQNVNRSSSKMFDEFGLEPNVVATVGLFRIGPSVGLHHQFSKSLSGNLPALREKIIHRGRLTVD